MSVLKQPEYCRAFEEPARRSSPQPSPIAIDMDRVLKSVSFRRLAGKTQVFFPDDDNAPRNRLTHSLEVAHLAKRIGEPLGYDGDLLYTAGLSHDLGHPPFGHSGERALNSFGKDCGFEGNAQALRVLSRLEPMIFDESGESRGCNLTRATLRATLKYPWPAIVNPVKYCAYAEDIRILEWVCGTGTLTTPSPEAQIVNWADDIAYSVHDIEDGVVAGEIPTAFLADHDCLALIISTARSSYCNLDAAALEEAAVRLRSFTEKFGLMHHEHSSFSLAAGRMKLFCNTLIERFVNSAIEGGLTCGGFESTAIESVTQNISAEIALLKATACIHMMSNTRGMAVESAQREVIWELAQLILQQAPDSLDPLLRSSWVKADGSRQQIRIVLDQISLLTDLQALRWHAKLSGRRRPVSFLRSQWSPS